MPAQELGLRQRESSACYHPPSQLKVSLPAKWEVEELGYPHSSVAPSFSIAFNSSDAWMPGCTGQSASQTALA